MESELINAKKVAISYELNGNLLQAIEEYQKAVKFLTNFIKLTKNQIMIESVKERIHEYKNRVESLKSRLE